MSIPSAGTGSRRGFTLFEVLAAVVIFGLSFTMLAQVAMQGLAAEGEASRRLRASLLADRLLGDVEGQLAAGAAPPQGLTEEEIDEFTTEIEVRPYDFTIHLEGADVPDYITEGTRGERPLPLLEPPNRGAAALVQLDIRVRWLEGAFERVVTRSTFALDPTAVEPLIASLLEESENESTDDEGDEDDETDGDDGSAPAPFAPSRQNSPSTTDPNAPSTGGRRR